MAYGELVISSGSCSKGMWNTRLPCWTCSKTSTTTQSYIFKKHCEPKLIVETTATNVFYDQLGYAFGKCNQKQITEPPATWLEVLTSVQDDILPTSNQAEKLYPGRHLKKKKKKEKSFLSCWNVPLEVHHWKCCLYSSVFTILSAGSFFNPVQDWKKRTGKPLCQRNPLHREHTETRNCLKVGYIFIHMYHLLHMTEIIRDFP